MDDASGMRKGGYVHRCLCGGGDLVSIGHGDVDGGMW